MSNDNERETREQKRLRQTQGIHAALGRYVEAFEQLVDQIRAMCVHLTSHSVKHQRLMSIVFHYETMTAKPLFSLYRAFIGEMINDKDTKVTEAERAAILGVLRTFDTDFQAAVNKRNDFLHGTWRIGWGNDQTVDFSSIAFQRFKVKNEGLVSVPGPKSAKEIEPLIEECERLNNYFLLLHATMTWHTGPRVAKNFMLDPTGKTKRWIKRPPKT